MTAEIWEFINKSSQLLGVIGFFPIIYSAFALYIIRRKKKQELERIRNTPGDRPGILIIDSIRDGYESIQSSVENWLWQQAKFVEQKEYTRIENVVFHGDLNPDDMADMTQKIRRAVGSLQSMGVSNYHIFIRGPVGMACVVGCVLANHRPSIIYQQAHSGGYISWGAINQ